MKISLKIISIIIIISFMLFSCHEKMKHTDTLIKREDSLITQAKSDSSEFIGIDPPVKLPAGIYLDTLINDNKIKHSYINIVLPKTLNNFFLIDKEISRFVKSGRDFLYQELKLAEEQQQDTTWGAYEEISTLVVYKSERIISYSLQSAQGSSTRMRHFFQYFTVNYDLKKQKLLTFPDYFKLKTRADSNYWKYIIKSACKWEHNIQWLTNIKFAIDDEKIYFYFDMGEGIENAFGIKASVKKKYILDHIKDEYK